MRQITLSTLEYPTETKALVCLQEQLLRLNGPETYRMQNKPTLGLVIDRFTKEERIAFALADAFHLDWIALDFDEIPEHGTLKQQVQECFHLPTCLCCQRQRLQPFLDIQCFDDSECNAAPFLLDVLLEVALVPGCRAVGDAVRDGRLARFLFQYLVKPQTLAPEKFQELVALLKEPYRTVAIVAMCTGLRVSEVLALRWEHIDFKAGLMMVQQGVVNGRIGRVKTEASQDEVPLDPAFAHVLLDWKVSGQMAWSSLPMSSAAATTLESSNGRS